MADFNLEQEKIKEAIVRTIAFFDLFDYPLTAFEVWKYLSVKCNLNVVEKILADKNINIINQKNGFYFLAGRENILAERRARYNYADFKFRRAAWMARVFKLIPWIKLIGVVNIIGAGNLRDEGDIDMFVVARKGRLWLTRLFAVFITKALGLRPSEGNIRNKICLSFFVSEDSLDVENLRFGENDIYFPFWLTGMRVIYDEGGIYEKLIKNNNWIFAKLPNWQASPLELRHQVKNYNFNIYKILLDKIFGSFEMKAKKIQINLMNEKLKNMMNKDTRVVVNDNVLKFHSLDRREEYWQSFSEKISKINLV